MQGSFQGSQREPDGSSPMRRQGKRIFRIVLLMATFLLASRTPAYEQPQENQTTAVKPEPPPKTPGLADITPLAAELAGRLATLQIKITDGLDVSEAETKYEEIRANLKNQTVELQRLKDLKDFKYNKLVVLREAVKREHERFDEISEPIYREIGQLGAWRQEWLEEKRRWNEWENSLVKEQGLDQLQSTFVKANGTIDAALNLVFPHLKSMLEVQEKAGLIDTKLQVLTAELDALAAKEHRNTLLDESPPMLSFEFLSQFRSSDLWYRFQRALVEISWPGSRFFAQQGWIVLLQGFLLLLASIAIYRNRVALNQAKRWQFIAARPLSAGLFLSVMTPLLIYEYQGAPAVWRLSNSIVAGITFARLIGALIEASWKRQFIYGSTIVYIMNRTLHVFNLPLPLYRLYLGVTALVGLFFCLLWARESLRRKDSGFYVWSLRSFSLFLAIIVVSQLWLKRAVTYHLFLFFVTSIAVVLIFMLFMYMIHGGLEWMFRTSPLRRASVLYRDTDALVRRVGRFIDVAMCGLVLLPAVLTIWGVYDNLGAATMGLLALGFNLGSQRISVGLLLVAAAFVYGSFVLSWILQNLLIDEVFLKRGVERGVGASIKRLVHYVLMLVGFLLAITTLGFEITKLTIMLSALGVGIGFGLQGVVNNFVSGLVLLFERPVRVGDIVVVNGIWSEIKRIGLRSTTLQSFDQSEVIIPNADLITNQVTNWTLSNRRRRLEIKVGVAYGSDVLLVMKTLAACAKSNPKVDKTPEPQVLFLSFGESSLNFELWVFVSDVGNSLNVITELHQEIDRRFREAKIEIAFPQQDLHLRSVDESAFLRPSKAAK
jgi:potassium efflux system protein